MANKLELSILGKSERYSLEYVNVDSIVNNEFVKSLRKKLNMTQVVFAGVLGVKKKTVEKWEQGKNPVKGGTARLLYVLNLHPDILDDFYKFRKYESEI